MTSDRMKIYEMAEAGRHLLPLIPVMARLDGRSFSNFTAGLARPYDERLSKLMVATTKFLVEETNANCGYTQSDEITLTWLSTDYKSQIFFNGRIQKLCSALSALASVFFNSKIKEYLPEKTGCMPIFDCRVWNVPNPIEGSNAFLWREQDATKNSISMAARHYYSHKQLMNKSGPEMQEMLFQAGINWNDYPSFFKRGTYIQRKNILKKFEAEEIEKLPKNHEARQNKDLMIKRSVYTELVLPKLSSVSNRVEVIYNGDEPLVYEDELSKN